MSNRVRVTLTSFLAYAVIAGMLSQIGIMINPMTATNLQMPNQVGSFCFSMVLILAVLARIKS